MDKEILLPLAEIIQLRYEAGLETNKVEYENLSNAVKAKSYCFFYNIFQEKCGYLIWAETSKETLLKSLRTNRYPAYWYEWKEKPFCLIYHVLFLESGKTLNNSSLLKVLRDFKFIGYRRNKKSKLLIKKGRFFKTIVSIG